MLAAIRSNAVDHKVSCPLKKAVDGADYIPYGENDH